MLMQGLELPFPNLCSSTSLPPAQNLPTTPPPLTNDPHPFPEPPDTMGQAQTRRKVVPLSSFIPAETSPLPPTPSDATTSKLSTPSDASSSKISRTTEWRHRKSQSLPKQRKQYSCRVCGNATSDPGHTQYRGYRYCPHAPGQIPKEEWLAQIKTQLLKK